MILSNSTQWSGGFQMLRFMPEVSSSRKLFQGVTSLSLLAVVSQ